MELTVTLLMLWEWLFLNKMISLLLPASLRACVRACLCVLTKITNVMPWKVITSIRYISPMPVLSVVDSSRRRDKPVSKPFLWPLIDKGIIFGSVCKLQSCLNFWSVQSKMCIWERPMHIPWVKEFQILISTLTTIDLGHFLHLILTTWHPLPNKDDPAGDRVSQRHLSWKSYWLPVSVSDPEADGGETATRANEPEHQSTKDADCQHYQTTGRFFPCERSPILCVCVCARTSVCACVCFKFKMSVKETP